MDRARPPETIIDLRSDTKSPQTAEMRQAMALAHVGDEQAKEDPSVLMLCSRVAELLGKEDALLLPSGTMCNQLAILVQTRPGDEIILAESAHVMNSESGSAAAVAGVQLKSVCCNRGILTSDQALMALRPDKPNAPRSSMVIVEQTTTPGAVWSLGDLRDLAGQVQDAGLRLHIDGARILNAQVASGIPAAEYGALSDSVWLDLSKGLGCPVGAVLAGSSEFIREAWAWKFRLGGAMRQSGFLAAAGIYALDHHVERLAEDHINAHIFAEGLSTIEWIDIDVDTVESNILFFDVSSSGMLARDVVAWAEVHGLRLGAYGPHRIRAVTHLGITRNDINAALGIMKEITPNDRKSGFVEHQYR